jgi:hypothetical protein
MAQAQNKHEYVNCVEVRPKNPKYKERMYINGFLGFISTTYKKEMISHEGYETIHYCGVCGEDEKSDKHKLQANPYGIN